MKYFFKHLANLLALVAVIMPFCAYRVTCCVIGVERTFPGWSQLFSLLPGLAGIYLRRAFYRLVLPVCGRDVCICFGTVFSHSTASLGDRVYIGIGCMVGDATLEEDVLVGSHVSIINGRGQHGIARLDIPVREQRGQYPRIMIGRDAWLGDRAVVTENVGVHAVVGAAAVVTKLVPNYAIVVGNPARVHGFRDHSGKEFRSSMEPAASNEAESEFAPRLMPN